MRRYKNAEIQNRLNFNQSEIDYKPGFKRSKG